MEVSFADPETGEIVKSVRAELAEVESVEEAAGLQARYSAIVDVAKKARLGLDQVNQAVSDKLWTERRAGELLAESGIGPGRKGSTLEPLGINKQQSHRWQLLAKVPEPDFERFITDTIAAERELSTAAALKYAKQLHPGTPRSTPPPTAGLGHHDDTSVDQFATIVIDPPWRYDNTATRAAAEDHYPTMTQSELLALELPTEDNAHLYLWVTNSFIEDGFALLRTWGFTYKTCLTWCKPQIGMGNYFRATTEHVLFGVKGRLPTNRNDVPTHFVADRTRHSAKPESFYDLVESCSPGPYLEMFARRRRFGWSVWGNEA